ncbi:LysR family transcriptional regulator [Clostridium fermenticellae]|uniref:LysR family transcriptional regulator n=1 Tax=Clostridium fermenticellae TaxID=2068654 RepID=A0A386H519_9CLOT|nr:LysR family transcriptional regulator [Clostridium fermenticellae]AYD40658.1 LysR family transcriptional regulator [Clostridium fermenticellae]
MNDTQVKCFLEIAYEESFTKAANNLYITQPAISRYMSAFEKELGIPLFNRTNKHIKLTAAGEVCYDFFRRFQLEFENTMEKAHSLNCKKQGTIRLGYIVGWSISSFLPNILEKFSKEFPDISVSVESLEINELIKALNTNNLDVILTLDNSLDGIKDINKQKVVKIQKLILYSKFQKLPKKQNLTPYDFKDETFYVIDNQEAHNAELEIRNYCKSYGFVPHLKLLPNMESIFASVENGLGVTFFDTWGKNIINAPYFKYVLLDSNHEVSMAWNKNNKSEVVRMLVNEFIRNIK